MEKLNLGELIIHQMEFDLQRKQRYETKAIGIVAIVAFVIGIITTYIGCVFRINTENESFICYLSSCCWCRRLFIVLCLGSCCATYIIGFALLLLCVNSLKGRKINFIEQDKLFTAYQLALNGEDVNDGVIRNCVEANKANVLCNQKLEQNAKWLSKILLWFVLVFMFSAIMAFFLNIV